VRAGQPNVVVPLAALLAAFLAAGRAQAGPAEDYIDAQLRVVSGLEARIDSIADVADRAAKGLLAGGEIYLAGEPGMVAELLGRAGGLCGAKAVAPGKPLPKFRAGDLVFYSDYGLPHRAAAGGWDNLCRSSALVVAFTPADNPILRGPLPANVRVIAVDVPVESCLVKSASGARLIPTVTPAVATAQWAFTAELIGACRRQHRQLAVYLSIFLDEGRRRLKRTAGLLFEPKLRPSPVARGWYAERFLATVRASLVAIRRDEVAKIRVAAGWLREAATAHRQIVRNFMGHLPPLEAGMPGDVDFFSRLVGATGGEGAEWMRKNLHEGDLYFFLGYQENEDAMAAAANALGARTIFITSRGPRSAQAGSARHLYVNPHWPVTDACLELPGYDVKACPLSCIMDLTCYYAICGEAVRK
jgi:hypothetical protein